MAIGFDSKRDDHGARKKPEGLQFIFPFANGVFLGVLFFEPQPYFLLQRVLISRFPSKM